MLNVSIARRYARALIEVAGDSTSMELVADQLDAFANAMQRHGELSDALMDPSLTREERIGIIQSLLVASGGANSIFENFLKLLSDRNRLSYVQDIARLYRSMSDVRAGRLRGKVSSAAPLSSDAFQKLTHTLERITQRNVVLETHVDPSLLGGVSAQVGSVVYDGTLKTQLDELKQTLSQQ